MIDILNVSLFSNDNIFYLSSDMVTTLNIGFLGDSHSIVRIHLQCRRSGSVSGLGRPPGAGHSNPLQYSCLESPKVEEPGGLQSMVLPSQTGLSG